MTLIIDQSKIGTKGCPMAWKEFGFNPPMIDDGRAEITQPPIPMAALPRENLLSYLESKLKAVCTTEITVNIAPSVDAVAFISGDGRIDLMGLVMFAQSTGAKTVTWYQSTGNIEVDVPQLIAIGSAVLSFRAAAVSVYSQLLAQINDGAATSTAQIDAAAWPKA